MFNYLLLILSAVLNVVNVLHCEPLTMCVHQVNIGFDELGCDIFESRFSHDTNDTCDYIELNKEIDADPEDLIVLNLNIRGLYSKLGKLKLPDKYCNKKTSGHSDTK